MADHYIEIIHTPSVDELEPLFALAEGGGCSVAFRGSDALRCIQGVPGNNVYIVSDEPELDSDLIRALDEAARSTGRTLCRSERGWTWPPGELNAELRTAEISIEGVAVLRSGRKFRILDPFDAFTGLKRGILGRPEGTFLRPLILEERLRCFAYAAEFALRFSPRLKDELGKEALDWDELADARRGTLLVEILRSANPSHSFIEMLECGAMKRLFPFIHDLAGVEERVVDGGGNRKRYQHKDVFYHTMKVLENAAEKSDNVWFRMAALLHDIAKPATKQFSAADGWTFHGHAEVGARFVKKLFRDYELPQEHRNYVRKLVALHLRPIALVNDWVTDSAVRRLITDAGDLLEDLLTLCRCDITSKNIGKVTRYLNNYDRLVDTIHDVVARDKVREWQPPVTGQDIMERCGIPAGILVGILKTKIEDAILQGVIENNRAAALLYLQQIKDDVIDQGEIRKPDSIKKSLKSLPKSVEK